MRDGGWAHNVLNSFETSINRATPTRTPPPQNLDSAFRGDKSSPGVDCRLATWHVAVYRQGIYVEYS
eukprot:55217-Pyramimonas_sp.AAC.1